MSDEDNKRKLLQSKAGVPAKVNYQSPARHDDTAWIALYIEDCVEINEKMDVVVKLAGLNGGEIEEYRDIVPMLPQIWTEVARIDKPATPEHTRAIACWLVEVKPQANVINRAAFYHRVLHGDADGAQADRRRVDERRERRVPVR